MPRGPVEASGGTMANIVKANTYLIDIQPRRRLWPSPRGVLRKEMPAHTLVMVTALAALEFQIEIEAIAVL